MTKKPLAVVLVAAALLGWTPLRSAEPGFVSLFNGRDLSGWEGNTRLWLVEDGMIVGRSPGIKHNDFLNTRSSYRDFELRLSFHLKGGIGNSGIQFRSKVISEHVSGYQADIGENYWASLYDEARRNRVLAKAPVALDSVLKRDGWNDYRIRAEGNRIQLWLNGLQTVDYRETDASIETTGIISLQIHSGGPLEIRFKNLRIKELKSTRSALAINGATTGFALHPTAIE